MTKWTEHVRKWSADNGVSYMCATSMPECKEAYKKTKAPKNTQKANKEQMGMEDKDVALPKKAKKGITADSLKDKISQLKEAKDMGMEDRDAPQRRMKPRGPPAGPPPLSAQQVADVKKANKASQMARLRAERKAQGLSNTGKTFVRPRDSASPRELEDMGIEDIKSALLRRAQGIVQPLQSADTAVVKPKGRPKKYATAEEAKRMKSVKTVEARKAKKTKMMGQEDKLVKTKATLRQNILTLPTELKQNILGFIDTKLSEKDKQDLKELYTDTSYNIDVLNVVADNHFEANIPKKYSKQASNLVKECIAIIRLIEKIYKDGTGEELVTDELYNQDEIGIGVTSDMGIDYNYNFDKDKFEKGFDKIKDRFLPYIRKKVMEIGKKVLKPDLPKSVVKAREKALKSKDAEIKAVQAKSAKSKEAQGAGMQEVTDDEIFRTMVQGGAGSYDAEHADEMVDNYSMIINHLVEHISDPSEPVDPRDYDQAIHFIREMRRAKGGAEYYGGDYYGGMMPAPPPRSDVGSRVFYNPHLMDLIEEYLRPAPAPPENLKQGPKGRKRFGGAYTPVQSGNEFLDVIANTGHQLGQAHPTSKYGLNPFDMGFKIGEKLGNAMMKTKLGNPKTGIFSKSFYMPKKKHH